jgi:hypothetical protein
VRWEQGQHVCIVGQTGTGKTYLENRLLQYRDCVIFLRSKADKVKLEGFRRTKTVDGISIVNQHKWELYPEYKQQRYEFSRALHMVWEQGSWCVDIDELFYMCDRLRLDSDVEMLLTQGRSLDISVVCGMQRPSRITRFAMSEPTHYFFFHAEGRDVKMISDATTPRIVPALAALKRYEFAYFNRITNAITIGRAENIDQL